MSWLRLDNRYLPPLLITCDPADGALLVRHPRGPGAHRPGDRHGHHRGAGARPHHLRRLGAPASAYITGISVGILLRSPFLWPYFLCSFISILSKYVLRIGDKHLWNPSNLGVSLVLFLAPETVVAAERAVGQRGGADGGHLGAGLGDRLPRRAASTCRPPTWRRSWLFSVVRSMVTGTPWLANVAPITGPMYQLFIFFMVTDPKTTVGPKWAQCVVVFIVAFVEMMLRLNEVVYAPFYALCLVGPSALLVEAAIKYRRQPAAPQARLHGMKRSSRITTASGSCATGGTPWPRCATR